MINLPSFSDLSSKCRRSVSQMSIASLPEESLRSMSGWLQKRSSHLIKRWQWRFFSLYERSLRYYRRSTDVQPACTLNFNQVSVSMQITSEEVSHILWIFPLNSSRSFQIRALTAEVLFEWVSAISEHIESSEGYRSGNLTGVRDFWRFPRLPSQVFVECASSGDLLLFTSKGLKAKVQRALTRSQFDHVALILRFTSGKVCLFEATGQNGVSVVTWNYFIKNKWHLLYSRLVYRALDLQRTPEFLEKLQNFVKKSKGKRYKLSPSKLLFSSKPQSNDEHFFCSELVARAYQSAGVLPRDLPAAKFMPGHFAGEKQLQLVQGSLGEKELIDFDLDTEE